MSGQAKSGRTQNGPINTEPKSDDFTELTDCEFDHQGYIRPKRIIKMFNMSAFCKYRRRILYELNYFVLVSTALQNTRL